MPYFSSSHFRNDILVFNFPVWAPTQYKGSAFAVHHLGTSSILTVTLKLSEERDGQHHWTNSVETFPTTFSYPVYSYYL